MNAPPLQLGLILFLDREGDIDGEAVRRSLAAYGELAPHKRILVMNTAGGAGDGLAAFTEIDALAFVTNPTPHLGPIAGLRRAMRSLPLLDAFFLARVDDPAPERKHLEAMAAAYVRERLRLGRIVTTLRADQRSFPWLIDLGFRQPFVELSDDGMLANVPDANPSQVYDLPAA